ncbi:hypothetical protein [Rufibacter radiotolerans]|uniref:hypothetical protein n=1 Tax=Rufibacter radiotolerans TaxID=1379910 RepID=UPI0006648017|nr:hypothetical protein [Rufibacter radiotolerans]
MMKKILNYAFLLLAGTFLLASCLPEENEEALKYQGSTYVEFKNQTLGILASTLRARGVVTSTAQTDSSRVIAAKQYSTTSGTTTTTTAARTVDSVLVQLVGPHRSTPTEVTFEVIAGSTAVQGTDFTLDAANTGNKVVIPANSSFGYILLKPIVGGSAAGTTKRVGFKLLDAGEVKASPNYDTFYVSIFQP